MPSSLLGRAFASCLAVLCLFALVLPAAAGLHVEGGSSRAPLFRTLYDKLPDCWKTDREVIVREVSDREMRRLIAEDKRMSREEEDDMVVQGFYDNDGDGKSPIVITLRSSLSADEARMVFTHEYGHYVWDDLLTKGDRNSYGELWQKQRRRGRLITRYAGDSREEGFAEAFAYFLRDPDRLRRKDVESFLYLDVLVQQEEP
jgi:hypothetical protein